MSFRYTPARTKGVMDEIRGKLQRIGKPPGKFVKLHAKVEFVDDHLMTAEIRHGKFKIITDEPVQYGGYDVAPAPLEYFVAGFAMCEAAQYLWQIADMELEVDDISLEVKTANAWSPVLPEGTDETPELSRIELIVDIDSPEPRERIEELVARAARHCPAHNSLERPLSITTRLRHNEGREEPVPAAVAAEEIFSPVA